MFCYEDELLCLNTETYLVLDICKISGLTINVDVRRSINYSKVDLCRHTVFITIMLCTYQNKNNNYSVMLSYILMTSGWWYYWILS